METTKINNHVNYQIDRYTRNYLEGLSNTLTGIAAALHAIQYADRNADDGISYHHGIDFLSDQLFTAAQELDDHIEKSKQPVEHVQEEVNPLLDLVRHSHSPVRIDRNGEDFRVSSVRE